MNIRKYEINMFIGQRDQISAISQWKKHLKANKSKY